MGSTNWDPSTRCNWALWMDMVGMIILMNDSLKATRENGATDLCREGSTP